MTNEERRELEKLAEAWEQDAWDDSREGRLGASWSKRHAKNLRATLDRLTDKQSEPTSAKRAAELADAIMREAHESTTHPDRREIEFEPMRLHEGDLVVVDDVEYEVSAAVHGRTLDRVTLRRRDHSPEPPDSTEPDDDVVERVARWLAERSAIKWSGAFPETKATYRNDARNLLHDTGILTTKSETP